MKNNDMEKIRAKYKNRITRGKAIKLYCKEQCCAGYTESWKNCSFNGCFLHNFRLGKELYTKTPIQPKTPTFSHKKIENKPIPTGEMS